MSLHIFLSTNETHLTENSNPTSPQNHRFLSVIIDQPKTSYKKRSLYRLCLAPLPKPVLLYGPTTMISKLFFDFSRSPHQGGVSLLYCTSQCTR
ncbi:hypothetical protein TNIN_430081 [Trichonephila inaurata madagascariensis]|uniref:Uncharacterized protein n=1 Tax=Trichonephila inaurata madagascariensis TaxID=2747483 RepID=A0A8X7C5V1_9ARAC|nr:hypothetical protein TNIN_430081 [Trichonephila inaurata madagascariensis]